MAARHPIRHITTPCRELAQLNREQLEQTARDSHSLSSGSRLVFLFLGVAGPLGGLIGGYGIARGLARSITKLRVRLQDVVDRLSPLPAEASDVAVVPAEQGIQLTLTADGDLHAMEQQLGQVMQRVEEMVQRLQRQQREIWRAEQLAALGHLATSVAHEVRNPLTGMKLLVEAALRPDRPQALSQEDLEVILGEITRLEETVRHFLDFARPQPLVRQVVDLREAVNRPVELVRSRARQQGVSINVDVPEVTLPALLDRGQFGTVLVNLLLNALDAMPCGGQLSVALRGEAGGSMQVTVADTGPGIDRRLLGRPFTPFSSTKPTGTGLGLSISERIIHEHGGTLAGENPPEGGARFTITLPAPVSEACHAVLVGR